MRVAILTLLACLSALGQDALPQDQGISGLVQKLRQLSSPYRVLHIVAHPDDEDGPTLTHLSRGLGAEVVIASITRGESGANLVTGDFFDALGVLRTLEFRKAAQFYGAGLRFTRFADFGYSKTLQETLSKWERDEVTRELVAIIREVRPHVVLSRFQGGPPDGHGHHQAAGLLARDAYRAAGDPSRYPKAGQPWQPAKLYANNIRDGGAWTVAIDSGVYDPALGMTYAEFARLGLRFQRSQGAGSAIATPGPAVRRYKLVESAVGFAGREASIFERIEGRLPLGVAEAAAAAAEKIRANRSADACVPDLLRGHRAVRQARLVSDSAFLARREAQFEAAVSQALGLRLTFLVEPGRSAAGSSSFLPFETVNIATPGQTLEIRARLFAAGELPEGVRFDVEAPAGWRVEPLEGSRYLVTVPEGAQDSAVHWHRASVWDLSYATTDQERWSRALPRPPLRVRCSYRIRGTTLHLSAAAQASYIDSERIQRRRNLAVGPAVSVEFATDAGVITAGSEEYRLAVSLRSTSSEPVAGHVRLDLPQGWSTDERSKPFSFRREGEIAAAGFVVRPAPDAEPGTYEIRAVAAHDGKSSAASFRRILYPGLETAYLSRPARHEAHVVDVDTVAGLHIGYVAGSGDAVPEAIRQLGAGITMLGAQELASGDLSRFDAIFTGIRAYAVRDDLKAHNARLLEYVRGGGVAVVQYNTPEFDHNFGPFPYRMTRRPEEVSEEDSPVTILQPGNAVFQWPNRITEDDFDGWVEQRGSKFLVEWDERYVPLLETHDTGQAPQRGGWLAARHGKGLYVYCAYAWYRQLPYAVPGAVRIFANLLALGAPGAPWR
ncbi:MAG: PIG-L family deacetylase [Bryobacterales bacterium]|nr:PIG-L family deacetylase [Bryobacterales bacterium]